MKTINLPGPRTLGEDRKPWDGLRVIFDFVMPRPAWRTATGCGPCLSLLEKLEKAEGCGSNVIEVTDQEYEILDAEIGLPDMQVPKQLQRIVGETVRAVHCAEDTPCQKA